MADEARLLPVVAVRRRRIETTMRGLKRQEVRDVGDAVDGSFVDETMRGLKRGIAIDSRTPRCGSSVKTTMRGLKHNFSFSARMSSRYLTDTQ